MITTVTKKLYLTFLGSFFTKKQILFVILTSIFLTFFCKNTNAQDASVFPAPINPISIYATKAKGNITIDGKLDELDWQNAKVVTDFKQVEPFQGQVPKYSTVVKILFDSKNIYIGAFCKDTMGKKNIRVQDFRRDFDYSENDLFGVSFDPFNKKRNATVFQTNPYGALKDLQVFDDIVFDDEWDALWSARSAITDNGWSCEMSIPWKTLRYPRQPKDSTTWGINFMRIARKDNETSAFPGFPRSFDSYRMDYVALLKGIEPPPPSTNIQVNPYWVNQLSTRTENGQKPQSDYATKLGGEVKYSPTAHSSIDFTFNTDFAQADADRQVNNLKRFSIFFPERRQFFLENAGLFNAGSRYIYQPFFSRSIGLDNNGNPTPIDAGLRYTDKNTKYNLGAMYVHTRQTEEALASSNSVVSFSKNYGKQNSIGLLMTNKFEEANDSTQSNNNTSITLVGLNRITDKLSFKYTVSGSKTVGSSKDEGFAANTSLGYAANNFAWVWNVGIISKAYNPKLGFITRNDFIKNYADVYWVRRKKKWFPRFVRSFEPGVAIDFYQNISDLKLQEGDIGFYPIFFLFNNGAKFVTTLQFNWQNLTSNFNPIGIEIGVGKYQFNGINFNFSSDQSSKFSYSADFTTGGYYNGKITSFSGNVRYAPSPKIAINVSYETDKLTGVGINKENLRTQLITPNIRMALNPRLQFNVFYQYNTATERSRWNARLSWEYKPLSYVYFVFNENKTNGLRQDQSIAKISYLKQF